MTNWFMRTGAYMATDCHPALAAHPGESRDPGITPRLAPNSSFKQEQVSRSALGPDFHRDKRKLKQPLELSPRSLSALAVLIAGALIAAQALYIPAKAQVAQVLMSGAWEHQLSTGDPARPWPWADFTPTAKLRFPAQHRSVLALTDAAGESLAFGPTLMAASVEPGARGVAVFAAHRDTHFAFLKDVKVGDEIAVDLPGGSRHFRVTGSQVVRWDASGIQTHDGGAARIALVTCWPLDAKTPGPMRYVVWAELIPEPLSASTPSQA